MIIYFTSLYTNNELYFFFPFLSIQVSANPKIYVYDTPGVLAPEVKNISVGMKLALCCKLETCFLFNFNKDYFITNMYFYMKEKWIIIIKYAIYLFN